MCPCPVMAGCGVPSGSTNTRNELRAAVGGSAQRTRGEDERKGGTFIRNACVSLLSALHAASAASSASVSSWRRYSRAGGKKYIGLLRPAVRS